jgi:hypothetical protein
MNTSRTAARAGVTTALLCGLGLFSTVGFAQGGVLEDIFDRTRDRDRDRDDTSIFDRDRPIFERERDGDGLPYGATLLRAADTACQGALLASGLGRNADDVHGIRRGEERVFSIENLNVPWACLDASSARSDVMQCPEGTTDVRLSHDGNVARFECYGPGR